MDELCERLEFNIAVALATGTSVCIIDTADAEKILRLLKYWPNIVRCKDCVNCVREPNGYLYCDILAVGYEPLGSKKVTADWFCADGERRLNDETD